MSCLQLLLLARSLGWWPHLPAHILDPAHGLPAAVNVQAAIQLRAIKVQWQEAGLARCGHEGRTWWQAQGSHLLTQHTSVDDDPLEINLGSHLATLLSVDDCVRKSESVCPMALPACEPRNLHLTAL